MFHSPETSTQPCGSQKSERTNRLVLPIPLSHSWAFILLVFESIHIGYFLDRNWSVTSPRQTYSIYDQAILGSTVRTENRDNYQHGGLLVKNVDNSTDYTWGEMAVAAWHFWTDFIWEADKWNTKFKFRPSFAAPLRVQSVIELSKNLTIALTCSRLLRLATSLRHGTVPNSSPTLWTCTRLQ